LDTNQDWGAIKLYVKITISLKGIIKNPHFRCLFIDVRFR